MEFNKKLYELRKKAGLSQEKLADKLNVTRQTISKWELGEAAPDVEKLIALSDYFNISLDELVLGKEQSIVNENVEDKETVAQIIYKKIFTDKNKGKIKKGLKIAGISLIILIVIDIISMIAAYFIYSGIPS